MKIKQLEWNRNNAFRCFFATFKHEYFWYTITEMTMDVVPAIAVFCCAKKKPVLLVEGFGPEYSPEKLKKICQDHYESIIREGLEDGI